MFVCVSVLRVLACVYVVCGREAARESAQFCLCGHVVCFVRLSFVCFVFVYKTHTHANGAASIYNDGAL